jgi:hypothetical protein
MMKNQLVFPLQSTCIDGSNNESSVAAANGAGSKLPLLLFILHVVVMVLIWLDGVLGTCGVYSRLSKRTGNEEFVISPIFCEFFRFLAIAHKWARTFGFVFWVVWRWSGWCLLCRCNVLIVNWLRKYYYFTNFLAWVLIFLSMDW